MDKETNTEKLLQNLDDTTPSQDEELAFIAYQENVTRSKEEKRTRWILIALSVAIYLLGLGLFSVIVQTVYEINHIAGLVTGGVLVVLYTICFIIVIISIFSKHSFDLEFRKRNTGHFSERINNKVRWEIAKNINEQSAALNYMETMEKKDFVNKSEAKKVDSFNQISKLLDKYPNRIPGSKNEDSQLLADCLAISMRKDGVIYKKARKLILRRAVSTGCLTALSQNAIVDASVVAVKNMQLIKDIIWLYGFRPTNAEMTKILAKVVKNVCVAIGFNSLPKSTTWASKVFNKDSSNFLIQLLGQAIDMGAQFLGNGAMTYMVGKYTVNALLSQYRIQDLYRLKDLENYEMEMSTSTIHEINEEIKVEVKQLSNKPEEIEAPVKEALPTTEEAKKKKKWEFHLFRKTRSKVEKDKS